MGLLDQDLITFRMERVESCFDAAAKATGCTIKKVWTMEYKDLKNNSPLADEYASYMKDRQDTVVGEMPALGSTDFGDISYAMPSLHPAFAIPLPGTGVGSGNHTPGFAKAAGEPEAHLPTLQAACGIAATGLRVLTDEGFAKEVKKKFGEIS